MNIPRIPLHLQNTNIAKAAAKGSPSFETFRPNVVHPSGGYYNDMPEERATVVDMSRMRRYPNGQLDFKWAAGQLVDAIHALEFNGTTGDPNLGSASLTPIQCALLTIILPDDYRKMEPAQAEIMTKLSDSEKDVLRELVAKQMLEEDTYAAGRGGGWPGVRTRNVGG